LISKARSILRSLANAMVFVLVLATTLLALKQLSWLNPESGSFIAVDGDSLRKGDSEYRLHAIDAPELNQTCTSSNGAQYPCGREAQKALRSLVTGHDLSCRILETDRYGRYVVTCSADKIEINAEMVRLGWAIAYRRHGLDYIGAEQLAKSARRGIWQGAFETPEDWRGGHRSNIVQSSMADQPEPD
jgi:endonuclease YncB( thermonuclease family)